jgi:DNA-directed RNA polymerase sigma subunit (sigma70/sigma32)
MISLKEGRGKVPIINTTQHEATPYLLVDFPTWEVFQQIYSKHKSAELKAKYWDILRARSSGQTLDQSGKPYGITRERVRQIEARFQRLVGKRYSTQIEASLSMLSSHPRLVESFLNSETL